VTNAESFAVFNRIFTKGKTDFIDLLFTVPEIVTNLFCAKDVKIEQRKMAINRGDFLPKFIGLINYIEMKESIS
jgi:hypothetical protein